MAYLINKTDGNVLTTVADGQIDNLSTDITLIGKNYSGFGEALNENFVKLLENFAGSSRPPRPIRGQIWFDTTERKLKVYNGQAFQPVSSANISDTQPTNLTPGDLWFNNIDKQLYFYDGVSALLLGPDFSNGQGVSGFKIQTVLDTLNQSRTITMLYNNGSLLGIWSTDTFTPKLPIEGFVGSIIPGFNQADIAGFKLVATATNSESLGGIPADIYIKSDRNGVISGRLGVTNGIELGDGFQHKFLYDAGSLLIANTVSNRAITLSGRRGSSQEDSLKIEPESRIVRIYDGFTDSLFVTGGNLEVTGNLTVRGSLVTVSSETVLIEDKNIELASSTSPSDVNADGGGIILKGDTDHSLLWDNAKDAWVSSENIDLNADKYFSIDGTVLLKKTGSTFELTSAVTLATGIEIFGVQAEFTVDSVKLNDNRIEVVDSTPVSGTNINLSLKTKGTGNIILESDSGSPKIIGLGEPEDIDHATTKNYVDTQLRARPIVLSMDISDGIGNDVIEDYLEQVAPAIEYGNGTIARILCSSLNNVSGPVDVNAVTNKSTATFNTPGMSTSDALIDVTFSPLSIPPQSIIVSRTVKTAQIIGGVWNIIA